MGPHFVEIQVEGVESRSLSEAVDNFAAEHCSSMLERKEGDNFRVVQQRTHFEVALGTEAADNLVVD